TSEAATVFQIWWSKLYPAIWADMFKVKPDGLLPLPERTAQIMLSESYRLPGLAEKIVYSYKQATDSLDKLKKNGGLEWYKIKNTRVSHLAKLAPFSFEELKTGGWGNTVNAMKGDHGPSWRMVVEMKGKP